MSLEKQIMDQMKEAMKAKDTVALEALRAIKSGIILAKTESGAKEELAADDEIKLLQKLVKQRKDSATIYTEQGRADLAEPELAQVAVIEKFLPAQLSEAEIEAAVSKIIAEGGFSGMAAMGQVMGMASKQLAGQADGKTISTIVKKLLA
ncbi:GatB/YqeY domain-containing protein [Flavobacterium sp. NRK F10]|uniref:Glutamyl-tRNA amidotransferase n=1 Tax=Flavobacterium sediminis TaxID=2201181 RepID=A0A2U8QVD6_9FLAO|nr:MULTISPECIES: GatB/YqeY domain-containing protein [Flavobacterium]AWM14093.1 glutamyl-tRNA amidotransferase [Flavobacterium sediminis]MCO6175291.1 GatB/YqeY domain-containing protein [Flavobacterium sp. NRK F10]